ncbi:MAG TPA: hypothetical protein VM802_01445 [Chitinophaga sp.]|uniref:hypothetical protein n=1 Tax=Chitinophaga sp. TaxID=1869181 RepID=UPI002B5C4DB6|nr:hypothetical protein [Chitinophaga sp.]HVI43496.1 hypothetical protein [Chitinophaga sp.]
MHFGEFRQFRDPHENEPIFNIPKKNIGVFERLFDAYFSTLNLEIKLSELPNMEAVNKQAEKVFNLIERQRLSFQITRINEKIQDCKGHLYSRNKGIFQQTIIEDILTGKDYFLSEKRELVKTNLYYFIRPYYYSYCAVDFKLHTERCLKKLKSLATAAALCKEFNDKLIELQDQQLSQSEHRQLAITKLKWNGSAAVLGCILDELIAKGYLERPTSSYSKDAAIYLQLFELETTKATLAKELSDRTNSLCAENRLKLSLPKIEHLK